MIKESYSHCHFGVVGYLRKTLMTHCLLQKAVNINTICQYVLEKLKIQPVIIVSLRLRVQNAVPAQPCVGKLGISLVLLNFLHCNFRLWFKTP